MERGMTNQYMEAVAKHGIENILTIELRIDGRPKFRRAILIAEVDDIIADIERKSESAATAFADLALVLDKGSLDDEQAADAWAKWLLEMACRTARNPKKARRHAKTGRAGIILDLTSAPGGFAWETSFPMLRGDPLKRLLP
jgi:hypothetical protein